MRQLRLLLVSLCLIGLTGCLSMRTTSTLEADPRAEATLAGLKFRIASVMAEGKDTHTSDTAEKLQSALQKHYPALFNDDVDAIPLAVRMKSTTESSFGPFFLGMILTGTTIPFPGHEGFRMELEVTPWSAGGAIQSAATISYTRRNHAWMTVLSPLGLLPMPGRSDIERLTFSGVVNPQAEGAYSLKQAAFSEENLRKAVLTAVAHLDQPALRRYQAQLGGKPAFEVEIEGRRYSARLMPGFTQGTRLAGEPDQYLLVLRHREEREGHVRTSTWQAPVARRNASGEWEVQRHYLMLSSRPLVATALLENGVPARGMVLPVEAPPLADFIDAPTVTPETAAPVRWSNNILLQIKNDPLAAELAAKPLPELRDLITRLESSLLDLNERVGRANDRAQQAIEKGESPEAQRELAVVYRQRGEVLKAILQMVRQEAAVRGAP